MVTLHEVITFLVSMQISISSLQTHNVNRCGRSRHLARKLSLRRKRSSPNVFEMAADVLAAQPVTTNLLKFMRASIKMIGVSNLQSFIASMTQKLTLSDISDESKNYLDKAGITT